jgi:hypothetical protein
MTVKSFIDYNPDWQVIFWYPKFPYAVITWPSSELNYQSNWQDYLPELLKLPIIKKEVDFKDFGLSNEISEVHKSDFLRYYFLSVYGGVYSDMDILYFRPITNLDVNKRVNRNKETFVCFSHYGHSNGFFMSAIGSRFFKAMLALTDKCDFRKYQGMGPDLCNDYFPTLESIADISPVRNIGMEAVYYYDGQHVHSIYTDKNLNFPSSTIGLHWYAGSYLSGLFLRNTNGGLNNLPDNILGNLCKIIL